MSVKDIERSITGIHKATLVGCAGVLLFAQTAIAKDQDIRPVEPTLLRPIPGFELSCMQTSYFGDEKYSAMPIGAKVTAHGQGSRLIVKAKEPDTDNVVSVSVDFGDNGRPDGQIRVDYDGRTQPETTAYLGVLYAKKFTRQVATNVGALAQQDQNLSTGLHRSDIHMLLGIPPRAKVKILVWNESGRWVGLTSLPPFGNVILARWSISANMLLDGVATFYKRDVDEFFDPKSGLKVSSVARERYLGQFYSDTPITDTIKCEYVDTPPGYAGSRTDKTSRQPREQHPQDTETLK